MMVLPGLENDPSILVSYRSAAVESTSGTLCACLTRQGTHMAVEDWVRLDACKTHAGAGVEEDGVSLV